MFDSCNPWTVNHQPPLYIEFSRQEYWSGLSSSTPQDLRESEIEPVSLAFSACAATWKVHRQTLLLIAIIILSSSPLLCVEKKMATHCSIVAWEIPWTEEPGELQFMGSQKWFTTKQLNNNNNTPENDFLFVGICLF